MKRLKLAARLFTLMLCLFALNVNANAEYFYDDNNCCFESLLSADERLSEDEIDSLILPCVHDCIYNISKWNNDGLGGNIKITFTNRKLSLNSCNAPMEITLEFVAYSKTMHTVFIPWQSRPKFEVYPGVSAFEVFSAPSGYVLECYANVRIHESTYRISLPITEFP